MELILVLHNIRSCYNVGAILRTAEGFGVSEVILSGYTPRVHDAGLLPHLREKLDKEIHKTALGAEDMVKIENVACERDESGINDVKNAENLKALLSDFRGQGFKTLGLENHIKKETLSLNDPSLKEKIGEKCVLILGEEVHGIPADLYDLVDLFVEIPMKGQKESFNVSVAAGIATYELTIRTKTVFK